MLTVLCPSVEVLSGGVIAHGLMLHMLDDGQHLANLRLACLTGEVQPDSSVISKQDELGPCISRACLQHLVSRKGPQKRNQQDSFQVTHEKPQL